MLGLLHYNLSGKHPSLAKFSFMLVMSNSTPLTTLQGCHHRHHKLGLKAPRTDQHIENCFAICTTCYLYKHNVSDHPTSFTAALHADNLSLQHQAQPSCPHYGNPISGNLTAVSPSEKITLCGSCGALENAEITVARERKETAAYQVAARRLIRCLYCSAELPAEKKRWWICEAGRHECHWEGHEVR